MKAALLKLAKLGAQVIERHAELMGIWDGGDVQELLVKLEVYELKTMTESCGSRCVCVDIGGFPTDCQVLPDELARVVEALRNNQISFDAQIGLIYDLKGKS